MKKQRSNRERLEKLRQKKEKTEKPPKGAENSSPPSNRGKSPAPRDDYNKYNRYNSYQSSLYPEETEERGYYRDIEDRQYNRDKTANRDKTGKNGENKGKKTPQKRTSPSIKHLLIIMTITAIVFFILGGGIVYALNHGKTTEEPVPEPEPAPTDVFENAVFIGNSHIEALRGYNLIPNADFLCRVGLSIETVFTKNVSVGDYTALEGLKLKDYTKVITLFGENELGWPSPQGFIDKYIEFIEDVKTQAPNAQIYIMGILPITEEVSAENKDNTTNETIRKYNERLRIMADNEEATFIAPAAELFNNNLALEKDGSEDGIHLSYEYNKIWANSIRSFLEGEEK